MNLTKIFELDKTEKFTDEYNGEKYNATIRANAFSQSFLQGYRDAEASKTPSELARIIADVVVDWDVEMTEGEPFPPTYDNLLIVPSEFLWHLLSKIFETWNGVEADKKKSASS